MMKLSVALLVASVQASVPVSARAQVQAPLGSAASVPQQPQIIDLNLLEALIAIKAQDMAGVFGFIPEANAAPALADYLLHNRSSLKRFLKKGEGDLKELKGINEWDQQVYRYMLTIYSSGALKQGAVSKDYLERISKLSVAPALSLADITTRRKG